MVPLAGQIGVALVDPGELLDSACVDAAQAADLPLELADAADRLCRAVQLDAQLHGGGVAHLVALPQPVQNLPLLHVPGVQLLLQPGGLPLGVQHLVIAGLDPLIHGPPLPLQAELAVPQGRQTGLTGLPPQAQGRGLLGPLPDLPLNPPDSTLIVRDPLEPGRPVALHIRLDPFHVAQGLEGRLLLGG